MTRARKTMSHSGKNSGQITLSPDELRTASINVRDKIDVEAQNDRIVIYRISQDGV